MKKWFPIAHARRDIAVPHSLRDHAFEVGRMAADFAAVFDSAGWAELAGRWHDLGKFIAGFQQYLRAVTGFEADLADRSPPKVNHSSAGAQYVHRCLRELKVQSEGALALAYVIAGHHAGLPEWDGLKKRLGDKKWLEETLKAEIPADLLACASFPDFDEKKFGGEGFHLWVRMLFSCLVDADYLDTEAYFYPERQFLRGSQFDMDDLLRCFDGYMQKKEEQAKVQIRQDGQADLNRLRSEVLARCRAVAAKAGGFFSLTVPTGGGKTLSSLAFALEYAVQHRKRRVIYAIPFTSIIEQTADVFRDVFESLSPDVVLEHHSNADFEAKRAKTEEMSETTDVDPAEKTGISRLASENWDAPLVVTTNVQFFESLFANRPARCRKLHRIADSVVILDEAQLLPPDFLQPVLHAMKHLSTHYGVTFVLCTATQPALGSRLGRPSLDGLDNVQEIVANVPALYAALDRVRFAFPDFGDAAATWESLAEELKAYRQVLTIVNTRDDCRQLHRLMPKGTFHLSARMCAQHRSDVIAEIKARLAEDAPVRVVSTQLVEAGVDFSFPVVYRAMAGLDSIAQAAGRCNRENRLPEKGLVRVFIPPRPAPAGFLRFGEQATKLFLSIGRPEHLMPVDFARYFADYYGQMNSFDEKKIDALLAKPRELCFGEAAQAFSLIDDSEMASVIVPYAGASGRNPEGDISLLKNGGLSRALRRRLQRFTVSLYNREVHELLLKEVVSEPEPGFYVLDVPQYYSEETGMAVEDPVISPKDTIWGV